LASRHVSTRLDTFDVPSRAARQARHSQNASTCRASRASRVERVELCCLTSLTQPKCMGSTRRTCQDVTRQAKWNLGLNLVLHIWIYLKISLFAVCFRLSTVWWMKIFKPGPADVFWLGGFGFRAGGGPFTEPPRLGRPPPSSDASENKKKHND